MNTEYRIAEMVKEVKEKLILHWNYRGFVELPEVIRNHGINIQEIYLKWNRLSKLPLWIAELSNITNLYLHGNQIEALPDEIGGMTHLSTLDLGHNKLKTLPSSIGQLENLKILLLDKNLIGILPVEINQLKKLETLSVSGNKLIALPEWLGSLPHLQELMVDCNHLIELPNRLTLAPQLSTISVCSNRLQHLPLNGFLSAPCIQFDCNPDLSYLSLPVSYQLSHCNHWFQNIRDQIPAYRYSSGIMSKDDGCCKELKLNISLKVEISDEAVISTKIVKLPRQLIVVHNIDENNVLSLWEMALRQLYCQRFKHTLEVNHSTLDVKVHRTELYSENNGLGITGYMNNLLKNGPTSICLGTNCEQPIFTEAWIFFNSNAKNTFLQLSVFCSKKCLSDFVNSSDAFTGNWPWCIA